MRSRQYFPRAWLTPLVAALLLGCVATPPQEQITPEPAHAVNPACPDLDRWGAPQIYGEWSVELPDLGQSGRLLLRQHPEFRSSLRGEFEYGGYRSIASGDLETGAFNLDESRDGKTYHAFWTGRIVTASCGREIRGTWEEVRQDGEPGRVSRFVLQRASTASSQHGW